MFIKQKVREKLAKAEKKIENLSNLLESKDCEIRELTSVIADQQEDKNRVVKEELQVTQYNLFRRSLTDFPPLDMFIEKFQLFGD